MKLKLMALVLLGMFVGQSSAAFSDCYTRCFIFCMIDPSQTVCKCTTKCLKQCIFNSDSDSGSVSVSVSTNTVHHKADSSNLKFCKLGCALFTCSTLSKKHQPRGDGFKPWKQPLVEMQDGEKMDDCVGSCSRNCTKSY